jgi:hypothetical protein
LGARVSPGGSWIKLLCAFESQFRPKQLTSTSFDPLNGRGRELACIDIEPHAEYDWSLSPDGGQIVIRKNREAQLNFSFFAQPSVARGHRKRLDHPLKIWKGLRCVSPEVIKLR